MCRTRQRTRALAASSTWLAEDAAGGLGSRIEASCDQRCLIQLTDLIAHVAELLLRSTDRVNAAFDSIGPAASSVDRKRHQEAHSSGAKRLVKSE